MTAASLVRSPWSRTAIVIVPLLALAAVLFFDFYSRAIFPAAIGNAIRRSVHEARNGFNSVADLFAARSPGERQVGELASLKMRRQPALHERALPKVRRPGELGLLANSFPGAPELPLGMAPLAQAPLYNVVTDVPPLVTPSGSPLVGPPGGPPLIPTPLAPLIVPPNVPPPIPVPPVTALPEPASWAMMLIGFMAIGYSMRRRPISQNAFAR